MAKIKGDWYVKYTSNNSGGGWWLNDQNWIDLERSGWLVVWGEITFCCKEPRARTAFFTAPKRLCAGTLALGQCYGHATYQSYEEIVMHGSRYLGALATVAYYRCFDLDEGIVAWRAVTGQYPDAEGCTCCGEPHLFTREYIFGDPRTGLITNEEYMLLCREAAIRPYAPLLDEEVDVR